jgi:hypothetical protein
MRVSATTLPVPTLARQLQQVRQMSIGARLRCCSLAIMALFVTLCTVPVFAASQPPAAQPFPPQAAQPVEPVEGLNHLDYAMVRLPLACALGTALALRPRRRGTPTRQPEVVQTQIVLAIVGAVIMLVVGSNLARAFGIVGVASLIRYRAKIEDPKDAVVMLSALSVGLASGVGLYALSIFSAAFLVAVLSVIESFAPTSVKHFELKVKPAEGATALRPKIEAVLDRFKLQYELRTAAEDEVCYDVQVPFELETDRITNDILKLDAKKPPAVDWDEKKAKKT